jgi:hypothetical protein
MKDRFSVDDTHITPDIEQFPNYLLTRHALSAATSKNNLTSPAFADMFFYVVVETHACIEV